MKTQTKHIHILKQNNILDASILKCKCGLTFEWIIPKQCYKEQKQNSEEKA